MKYEKNRKLWTHSDTARKVFKCGVFSGPQGYNFSGPYFPVFGPNTEIYGVSRDNTVKYGPEKTPYLDTFHSF